MTLSIKDLSKRFGNKWVLKDISLKASAGSVFGVFGPAGSGKTSLLEAIAGKLKPNGGTISLDDIDIRGASQSIAYLSGCSAPSITTLLIGSTNRTSNGERQLAKFEKVLTHPGKVLLLDEPFCHMDESTRLRCFQKVRDAVRERTVIVASSDFDQIIAIADQAVVLVNGEIAQLGTPQTIYGAPETAAVASIAGENNIFAARRISSTNADLPEFQTINGSHRIVAQPVKKSRLGAINQNVMLSIRPEQVALTVGASFPEDNLIKALVTGIEFRGATSLIHFNAAGLKIKARVFKVVGLNLGDEFMLGLPPDRILVLKD